MSDKTNPIDINLIYLAGTLAGTAMRFKDGELESVAESEALLPVYRDMVRLAADYRCKLKVLMSRRYDDGTDHR